MAKTNGVQIWSINSDKKIMKLKQKGSNIFSDSFMEVVETKTSPRYVITLRNIGREFACDEYTVWGDVIIPNNNDPKMSSFALINKMNGKIIENVSRVQFGLGKCVVTYPDARQNYERVTRFIEKDGTLSKGVLGKGGFARIKGKVGEEDKIVFKDMNGNMSDKFFETFDGKILAGEIVRDEYLHWASSDLDNPNDYRDVCYDDFGRIINPNSFFDLRGAELLHNLSNDSQTSLTSFFESNNKCLLDDSFYNSLLEILRDRARKSAEKVDEMNKSEMSNAPQSEIREIMESYKKRLREIDTRLDNTIEELQSLRREAVNEYTNSLLGKI